jgi:hypothetical protein
MYECLPNKPIVETVWHFFPWVIAQATVIDAFAKYTSHGYLA